jgi:hypothetical protein
LAGTNFQITKDGQPIGTQVLYQTKIGIWNAGNTGIVNQIIRRAFTIEFTPNDKILETQIVDVKHNVSGFRKSGETNNSVKIDWDYFDPGFSFVATVFHMAN